MLPWKLVESCLGFSRVRMVDILVVTLDGAAKADPKRMKIENFIVSGCRLTRVMGGGREDK